MRTQQVADRLVGLCRQGQNLEAIDELYSDHIVSREMPGANDELLTGKEVVRQKTEQWLENVRELHSGSISDPVVAGNHFTCKMDYDVTFKDGNRHQIEEICLYETRDGKIVNEQFFYAMA